ncbi:MAG: alpha-amylase family glycosyl hydrolase [Bdellovibrionales bacterium]
MPNQKIYYVSPRMVGAIQNWSGADDPAGRSWLIDHAQSMGFNAMWFSPFHQTTAVEKTVHGQKLTGSYYAIKDHFCLDTEFSSGDKAQDIDHLRHFCRTAQDKGVKLYADLVFNHVAADHPLVVAENRHVNDILQRAQGGAHPIHTEKDKVIGMAWSEDGIKKSFHFKFRRKADFSLSVGGPAEDPWSDVAEVNYSSPAARKFFVEGEDGKKGYFKQVID